MINNLFKIQNPYIREIFEWIEIILIAIVITIAIRTYIIEPTEVSGSSMEPNLHNGDRLIVDRFEPYFGDPKRGDVVVFEYNTEKSFIKRVIGVPGDTIDLRKSTEGIYYDVYRNGELVTENYIKQKIEIRGDTQFPLTVKKDHFFVMGDNRNNSHDGRWTDVIEDGQVPKSAIRGPVSFRFWPLTKMGIVK